MQSYTHEESLSLPLIYQIEEMAGKLFETYLQEVSVDGSQTISVEIKQNNVGFFSSKNIVNYEKKREHQIS